MPKLILSMIKTNIFKKWRGKMSFLSARKNTGLTQKEVADQIGVDQTAVSFWENGKTLPRASLLSKIASLYGVTVDELLSDNLE
nr:MAG TPA: Repressor protein CI [Caudoviricetes sp.]